jgi:glutathione S-transferase
VGGGPGEAEVVTPSPTPAPAHKMADAAPLILYDISSPLQPRSYAPNPSKARLALSFKRVPFETIWVDILDIPAVRRGLACPAVRKLDDGSDFFTLPMLRDPATGAVIGDSFDIANYLEEKFPASGGSLFPRDSTRTGLDYESPHKDTPFIAPLTSHHGAAHEDYARFNTHVDATFTAHTALVAQFMPFNPASAEAVRALFAKRAHLSSWDALRFEGEARGRLREAFKADLASLALPFAAHAGGPYLEGARASYADLIVGGWLAMFAATMPREEWADFRSWHGGVFGRLHDALQEHYFVCS